MFHTDIGSETRYLARIQFCLIARFAYATPSGSPAALGHAPHEVETVGNGFSGARLHSAHEMNQTVRYGASASLDRLGLSARRIVVVGVGSAGVNAVARLADTPAPGVELVAIDTSAQTMLRVGALDPLKRSGCARSEVARTSDTLAADIAPTSTDQPPGALAAILLTHGTRGLGSGGDSRRAAQAAEACSQKIMSMLDGASIVVVVAGLAGGTGGGAAPVIARLAREAGAVTLGFGLMPFEFEPVVRSAAAADARRMLRGACHTTVSLENSRAVLLAGHALPLESALRVADDAVRQAVDGLGALVGPGGWIDVDVSRALEVLRSPGEGCVALGSARFEVGSEGSDDGGRPVREALAMALDSPLGGMCGLSRAGAAMLQVSAGPELAVADVADAAEAVKRRLPLGAELFVGASSQPALRGVARVMLLGAGIESRFETETGLVTAAAADMSKAIGLSKAIGASRGRPEDRDRHDPRRWMRSRRPSVASTTVSATVPATVSATVLADAKVV